MTGKYEEDRQTERQKGKRKRRLLENEEDWRIGKLEVQEDKKVWGRQNTGKHEEDKRTGKYEEDRGQKSMRRTRGQESMRKKGKG